MSRLIRNPFVKFTGYNCFGCSPNNPAGLKLTFQEEGDNIIAIWTPKDHFQGYHNLLHGGIQATLMDEIASWFIYVKMKTAGVTSKLEVKYKKPVYTNRGAIKLTARLISHRHNLVNIAVDLTDNEGKLCATGTVQYFTFSEKLAKKQFYYPNPDEFYFEK
ncbi:MAG TPA: PaaI family thioesterase [Bacteroidales bacterium]|nr:PaaI family thioesterase [Bacteroidales bacterium]